MYKLIFLLLISLLVNALIVSAQEPNYNIVITLQDKNVDHNEKIRYSVDITGSGLCADGGIRIFTEALFNASNNEFFYNNSLNPADLVKQEPIAMTPSKIPTDPTCLSVTPSAETNGLFIPLSNDSSIMYEGTNTYLIRGELRFFDKPEGGDYEINAIMLCKTKDGNWHSFENKNSFHVRFWLESYQFLYPIITLIVGAIIGFVGSYFLERNRSKKQYNVKLIEEVYGPLFIILNKSIKRAERFGDGQNKFMLTSEEFEKIENIFERYSKSLKKEIIDLWIEKISKDEIAQFRADKGFVEIDLNGLYELIKKEYNKLKLQPS